MIPDHLQSQLQETARKTFDEAKEALQDGVDEFEVSRAKQQAVRELTGSRGDFEELGFGAGRAAVTHPDLEPYAVKIALYSPRSKQNARIHGVAQNLQEAWTWEKLPKPCRSRFTPVEGTLDEGRLLVMPIVTTDHDEIPYDDALDFSERTKQLLHQHQWGAVELDVNTVGKRDSRLEHFDYGLPVEPLASLQERRDSKLDDLFFDS